MIPWPELTYWQSGEWQVVEERLHDLEKQGKVYNPAKKNLFKALKLVPLEDVKVLVIGQDPYPEHRHATGVAFHTEEKDLPPTLQIIFKEYVDDLHLPYPPSGDLTKWCKQGVLLWNAIPSCLANHSMSHDWPEWEQLTGEIIQKVSVRGRVLTALGSVAREVANRYVHENSLLMYLSHPSPRGNRQSKSPFSGARMFSTINTHLCELGLEPIDWRLDSGQK